MTSVDETEGPCKFLVSRGGQSHAERRPTFQNVQQNQIRPVTFGGTHAMRAFGAPYAFC